MSKGIFSPKSEFFGQWTSYLICHMLKASASADATDADSFQASASARIGIGEIFGIGAPLDPNWFPRFRANHFLFKQLNLIYNCPIF